MQRTILKYVILLIAGVNSVACAHEFWLEPHNYKVSSSDEIAVDLLNGENFNGSSFPFVPERFTRFTRTDQQTTRNVVNRLGAVPAMIEEALVPGLNIVAYESAYNIAHYDDFDSFADFVSAEGAGWAIDVHKNNRLPRQNFNEIYTRHAKSLISVDNAQGMDRLLGMEFEWLAMTNPYNDATAEPVVMQLWYQNQPAANFRVKVFSKENGATSETTLRTDDQGKIHFKPEAGRQYMLSAIQIRQPSPDLSEQMEAIWESLWATLTFEA
ncbi:MAG: DUF4198 domain-containing protein [Gammaproteobacteria bacterium]|nr:DUF4198 domain-containing protein [Gammaproteobacteria bacterium]